MKRFAAYIREALDLKKDRHHLSFLCRNSCCGMYRQVVTTMEKTPHCVDCGDPLLQKYWVAEWWTERNLYGRHNQRNFKTYDEAMKFLTRKKDDGFGGQLFGPDGQGWAMYQ